MRHRHLLLRATPRARSAEPEVQVLCAASKIQPHVFCHFCSSSLYSLGRPLVRVQPGQPRAANPGHPTAFLLPGHGRLRMHSCYLEA